MDAVQNNDELRQHVRELLDHYEPFEIHRMVEHLVHSRPISTFSNSDSSRISRASTDSRFSGLSTDYAPSLISSSSSHSRLRYDSSFYPSSVAPARHGRIIASSSASEVFSPTEPFSQPSPLPVESDSRSVASSTTRRAERSARKGRWFCTFCTEIKTFSAKSDWKKHEERYHETGEDWPCPYPECGRVFDREPDFVKHCQQRHPRVPNLIDIKVQLLPRIVFGCGFDGCKAVLMGWRERCNHVADQHMNKEQRTRKEWRYSNVIHNLLRQEATRGAWKELLSALETKQARYHISWAPENTRILRQKLQCSDMRPDVDIVLHTALSLRHGRPYNEVVELDPRFKTPSLDTVPDFHFLSPERLTQILMGGRTDPVSDHHLNPPVTPAHTPSCDELSTSTEPHPGTLVEYDMSHAYRSLAYAGRKRHSYVMDIDQEGSGLPSDPAIPWGIDQDPSHFGFGSATTESSVAMPPDGSLPQRRPSKGHIFQKSIKHFAHRLSPK